MNTERIRVMIADAGYEMLGRQLEAYNGERFDSGRSVCIRNALHF